MKKIEIDNEVFKFLQNNANPFIDTPNAVLRRLLLNNKKTDDSIVERELQTITSSRSLDSTLAGKFLNHILAQEFSEDFKVISQYQFMLKSKSFVVYFQNCHKERLNLWYRITKRPLELLKKNLKNSFLCFTYVPEMTYFMIPFKDVESQINHSKWDRDYLEVTLNYQESRWTQLDWYLKKYKKVVNINHF